MNYLSTSIIFENPADLNAFLAMFGFLANGNDSDGNHFFHAGDKLEKYATVFEDFTGKQPGQANMIITDFSKSVAP